MDGECFTSERARSYQFFNLVLDFFLMTFRFQSSGTECVVNIIALPHTHTNKLYESFLNVGDKINFILQLICFFIFRLERSKVRVTFFQSDKPQLISPPEPQHLDYFSTDPDSLLVNFSDEMASHTALPPNYNRQIR